MRRPNRKNGSTLARSIDYAYKKKQMMEKYGQRKKEFNESKSDDE